MPRPPPLGRAKQCLAGSRYLEAATLCQEVLAEDPDDVAALRLHAEALASLGRLSDAVASITRAMEIDALPRDYYRRADWLLEADEYDAAAADASRLIQLGEEEGDHYFRVGAFMIRAVASFYAGRQRLCRADCAQVPTTTVWWCKGKLHTVAMLLGRKA